MLTRWLIWFVLKLIPVYTQSLEALGDRYSEDFIPCEKDWFLFRDKCYILRGAKGETGILSWEKASERCAKDGGELVTIQSTEVQEFLVTFLLLETKGINPWIGLHDRTNESLYEWNDGSVVNFTTWEPSEPTGANDEKEDCVEMVFQSLREGGKTGDWNDIDCSREKPYICQKQKSEQTKKSPDPRFCLSGVGGGWKYQKSCYYVVPERKSWEEAEEHCQDKFKGHLVTIIDFTVDKFLDYILAKFNKGTWIGIKMQEPYQQKWTSGWHLGYNDLPKDREPFRNGTCVLRIKKKQWIITTCSNKYSFICETSTDVAPVPKPPLKGAHCPKQPNDWRDIGGEYCYFVDTTSRLNWYEANFKCMRRGGSLASIHSAEESEILHKFVIYTQYKVFIGLHRLLPNENVFGWADGSDIDYKNWGPNEPNNGDEKCSEMWTKTMKWNDGNCEASNGYICSVRKIFPNVTAETEENRSERNERHDCPDNIILKAVTGTSSCILLLVILFVITCYFYRKKRRRMKKPSTAIHFEPPIPTTMRPRYSASQINMKMQDNNDDYENMDFP